VKILFPDRRDEHWNDFCEQLFERLGYNTPGSCDHSLDNSRMLLERGGYDVKQTLAYFAKYGGHCDCEVLLNVDSNAVEDK